MAAPLRLFKAALIAVTIFPGGLAGAPSSPIPSVVQQNEGELRTRRPRANGVPSGNFLIKISPQVNGSKHLLVGYEEVPPGAMIPKHKHHGEAEVLLIGTGTAHVWLGDKEYGAQPGAVVFIPRETLIGLKNTGQEKIHLTFVFNEPGFEQMMRCASVPYGKTAEPITPEEVAACYQHGDAELVPVTTR